MNNIYEKRRNEIRVYLIGITPHDSKKFYDDFVKNNSDIISHHSYSNIAFTMPNDIESDSQIYFRINNEFDCHLEFTSKKISFDANKLYPKYHFVDATADIERTVYLTYLLRHYEGLVDPRDICNKKEVFTTSYIYKQDADYVLRHINSLYKHFNCENIIPIENSATLYEIVNIFTQERYEIRVEYSALTTSSCVNDLKDWFNLEINNMLTHVLRLYCNRYKNGMKELIKTSTSEESNQVLNYIKGDTNMSNTVLKCNANGGITASSVGTDTCYVATKDGVKPYQHGKANLIKSVTINDKDRVLTVVFNDKSVYMQKWAEEDDFDVYVGVALCVAKKYFKDNGTSVTAVKKFLDDKAYTMTEYARERAFKKQKKLEASKAKEKAKKKRQALARKVKSIKKD